MKSFFPFITLNFLTTGNTHCQRIFELSVLQMSQKGVVEKECTHLVSPKILISKKKRSLYGLSNQELAKQPPLEAFTPELINLLGTLPLVAHFCSYQLNFLKPFLQQHLSFVEYRFCTWRLARQLLPELQDFSLFGLCKHFHLKWSPQARAYEQAQLTSKIFFKLIELAQKKEINSLDELRSLQWQPPIRAQSSLFTPHLWPKAPGVFQMQDKKNKLLYIGKSSNLKSTLEELLHPLPRKNQLSDKLRKMIRDVDQLKVDVCGHELEAQVKEAQLVCEHNPPYNQLLNRFGNHVYLRVSTEQDVPRLYVTDKLTNKGDYFGPFQSRAYLQKIVTAFKSAFLTQKIPANYEEVSLPLFEEEPPEIPFESTVKPERFLKKIYIQEVRTVLEILRGNCREALENMDQQCQSLLLASQTEFANQLRYHSGLIKECVEYLSYLKDVTAKSFLVLLPGKENGFYHLLPVIQGRVHPLLVYNRYQHSLETFSKKIMLYYFNHQYPISRPLSSIELQPSLIVHRRVYMEPHDFIVVAMEQIQQSYIKDELKRNIPLVNISSSLTTHLF